MIREAAVSGTPAQLDRTAAREEEFTPFRSATRRFARRVGSGQRGPGRYGLTMGMRSATGGSAGKSV